MFTTSRRKRFGFWQNYRSLFCRSQVVNKVSSLELDAKVGEIVHSRRGENAKELLMHFRSLSVVVWASRLSRRIWFSSFCQEIIVGLLLLSRFVFSITKYNLFAHQRFKKIVSIANEKIFYYIQAVNSAPLF